MAPSDYSDRQLEDALRKEVKSTIATGKLEGLTVNAVRSQAERALDLPAGYFKNDSKWKDRSKDVITKAANQEQDAASKTASASSAPPTPAKKQETQKTKRAAPIVKPKPAKRRKVSESPSSAEEDMVADDPSGDIENEVSFKSRRMSNIKAKPAGKDTKAPAKKPARKAAKATISDQDSGKSDTEEAPKPNGKKTAAPPKQTKRSSKAVIESEEDDDELSEPDNKLNPSAPEKSIHSTTATNAKSQRDTSSTLSSVDDDHPSRPPTGAADQSESEMSVLIDDPPPPKRRKSASTTKSSDTKSSKKSTIKKAPNPKSSASTNDPQTQELKDLQSQLLKCGIRRIWSKELADYSTHKEKARHLKKLLEDIGMKGRFSNAKAAEIKERRELLAEVEAAKEFDEAFGESKEDDDGQEEEEESRGTKSRRLKNRAGGSQMLADLGFAADSDSDD